MITKRDCILLLTTMKNEHVNVDAMMQKTITSRDIDIDVIKFINNYRPLDANKFYEKLRKSYNNKKSSLYKNIVTCDEQDCTSTVLTTLAALSLQILLYSNDVSDKTMFLSHMKFEEIQEVLLNYARTFELIPCIQVLQVIKADLKAFEYINKNK